MAQKVAEHYDETDSEIGRLWREAVQDFWLTVKQDPKNSKYYNFDDIDGDPDVTKRVQEFQNFRHDGSKLDRLRNMINSNAEFILSGAGAIAGAASAAFPPAAAIVSALTLVLRTGEAVSKDYDSITDFFAELETFLERINMLRTDFPKLKGFRSHLVRVFGAILKMLGIASKAKAKGRLRKSFKAAVGWEDQDLNDAKGTLETNVKRFESAIAIAVLAIVVGIDRDVKGVKGDLKEVNGDVKEVRGDVKVVKGAINNINGLLNKLNGNQQESALSHKEDQRQNSAKLDQILGLIIGKQRDLQNQLTVPDTAQKSELIHKSSSLNIVRRNFVVQDDPRTLDHDIEFALSDSTTQWFIQHKDFKAWMEKTSRSHFLWVNGGVGMGKSFLAYSAVRQLQMYTASDSRASVAYFYFRQQSPEDRPMKDMLSAAVNQVAHVDQTYCDLVANHLVKNLERSHEKNSHEKDNQYLNWTKPGTIFDWYIGSPFKNSSNARFRTSVNRAQSLAGPSQEHTRQLFLVLDGLDEMPNSVDDLFDCLEQITTNNLNIQVLLLSRSDLREKVQSLEDVQTINVTKDDIENDMQAVISSKLEKASRLRRVRGIVKQEIKAQLLKKADGLLYLDHMLRRLNKCYGEGPILESLNELPANLIRLFEKLAVEVAARRTPEQLQTVRLLYAWVAFAKQTPSLEEVVDVTRLHGQDSLFSVEEEIFGRSGLILTITGDAYNNVNSDEDGAGIDGSQEAERTSSLVSLANDASTVRFHNRALRDFFFEADIDSTGVRLPEYHGNFLMFSVCVQTIIAGTQSDRSETLLQYAASYWALHFADIELSRIGDPEIVRGISLLHELLTNEENTASFLEKHHQNTDRLPYTRMLGRINKGRDTRFRVALSPWLHRASGLGASKFSSEVFLWIQETTAHPKQIFACLARAHVRNWLGCKGNMQTSYVFAASALNFSDLTPRFMWLGQIKNYWAIETTFRVFGDLASNAAAQRAVATTLRRYQRFHNAREHAEKSLELGVSDNLNNVERFSTLLELATIEYSLVEEEIEFSLAAEAMDHTLADQIIRDSLAKQADGDKEGNDQDSDEEDDDEENGDEEDSDEEEDDEPNPAFQTPHDILTKALEIRPLPDNEETNRRVRQALSLLAKCQYQLCKYTECVASVQEARSLQTESILTGDVLSLIPFCLYDGESEGNYQLMEHFQGWHFLEVMAWLTYEDESDDDTDPHVIFQHVAKATNQEVFLVGVYEQGIKLLGLRNAAGQMRNSLADFYCQVLRDQDKAKTLWLETMNSEVNINPSSGSEDNQPIWDAYLNVSNAIYHQFRTSSNSSNKVDLLREMRVLQESRGRGPLRGIDTYGLFPAVIYANMIRKVGSEQDFERVLREAFDSCYTALTDNEGWNDFRSLKLLAKILALVGGLEKEAQIAYSAQFSKIDTGVNHGDEEDDAEYSGSDDETGEWGEIAPYTSYYCSGEGEYVEDWSDGRMYLCLMCADIDLCQKCYDRVQAQNHGATWDHWKTYCGKNHRYIKGPVPGWRGVTHGIMTIGDNGISFMEWLEDLKANKWKKAWEDFWTREDDIKDVL